MKAFAIQTKFVILFIAALVLSICSFSQTVAYLDFRNPTLEAGTAGADGAQYRFSNVTTNVDAIVTLVRRSDALVYLLNPDMNTSGFDGAFQPQVGYNNGTTPGAADWWMEFNIQFVNNGTNNAVAISEFNVSGVDIDGNGQYINEYVSFFDMQDYSLEAGSPLAITTLDENINGTMLSGKRFDGPTANYTNIDTGATAVMVTNHYVNKTSFTVRTGGRSTDVSGAADRMYSFYFQNFAYNSPNNFLLALQGQRITRQKTISKIAVNVYPNPSNDNVNISIPDSWNKNDLSVRVFDTNGKLLGTTSNKTSLSVGSLKPGTYLLHISSGKDSAIQRIVKL
jgi:hypothetical protein